MGNCIDESAFIKDSKFGENIKVYKNARIISSNIQSHVVIGDNSVVNNSILGIYNHINRSSMIIESQIGDYSYGGMQLVCMHSYIGKFSSISWNVSIGGANHDYSKVTTHSFLYNPNFGMLDEKTPLYDRFKSECDIGNDVWIGAGAQILRGVHVGDGAVVAAGAIVASDVPPYSIVAGVPAKMIKMRFDEYAILKLLEIQWWDFPYDIIKKNIDLFNQDLNNEVLKKLQNIKSSIGSL